MRKINKALAVAALSAPLALGIASVASAHDGHDSAGGGTWFHGSSVSAGPDGSSSSGTVAWADEYGNVVFKDFDVQAGPDGASSGSTTSGAFG